MKVYQAPYYTRYMLEEMDESAIHFPFSDEDATYVGRDHQYELTSEYFEQRGRNLGIEVEGNEPDKVAHFLRALRLKVYTWIYTHTAMTPRQVINYLISKRGLRTWDKYEYRKAFLEAMFIEGCYLLDNGDISSVTGIDLDTMQNMSDDVMRRQDRDMHKDTIRILTQLGLNYYRRYRIMPEGEDW